MSFLRRGMVTFLKDWLVSDPLSNFSDWSKLEDNVTRAYSSDLDNSSVEEYPSTKMKRYHFSANRGGAQISQVTLYGV